MTTHNLLPLRSSFLTTSVFFATVMLLFGLGEVGCKKQPTAEQFFAMGQDALAQGKVDEAAIDFRRAIQVQQTLAKAHFALGKLELQRGNQRVARQEFQRTAELEPMNHDAQLLTGELFLRERSFKSAEDQAESMLQRWPGDKAALAIEAQSMMALGDYREAQKIIEPLAKEEASDPRIQVDLAVLQLHDKQTAKAEATLRQVWHDHPDNPIAPALLSNLLVGRGDKKGAGDILRQAVAAQPKNLDLLYLEAAFYMQNKDFASAEPVFRQIEEVGKDDPNLRGALAQFYQYTGHSTDAEREYQRLMVSDPKDVADAVRLALLEYAEKKPEEARKIIDKTLRENPNAWQALLLRGRMEMDAGQLDKAAQTFAAAKQSNPNSGMPDFDLARVYIAQGQSDKAKERLTDCLKKNPGYVPARVVLAQLQMKSGETPAAIKNLDQAVQQKPAAPAPAVLLAEAYLRTGSVQPAQDALDGLLQKNPATSETPAVLRTLAWVKMREGKYAEVTTLASKALHLEPNSPEALFLLGSSYMFQKQPERGLQVVEAQIQQSPKWGAGQEVLGKLALQAGKTDVALRAYQAALAIDANSNSATLGLAEAYALGHRESEAMPLYEKLAQSDPKNAIVPFRLGQFAEKNGDVPAATRYYEKAVELDPHNALAENNLAWLYAEHGGDLRTALRYAQDAQSAFASAPGVADTLGWVYIKQGLYSMAVPPLMQCVAKVPNNPSYHYHLGLAYFQLDTKDKAREELTTALRLKPDFNGAQDARKMLNSLASN